MLQCVMYHLLPLCMSHLISRDKFGQERSQGRRLWLGGIEMGIEMGMEMGIEMGIHIYLKQNLCWDEQPGDCIDIPPVPGLWECWRSQQ